MTMHVVPVDGSLAAYQALLGGRVSVVHMKHYLAPFHATKKLRNSFVRHHKLFAASDQWK